jgi:hypothetical protein
MPKRVVPTKEVSFMFTELSLSIIWNLKVGTARMEQDMEPGTVDGGALFIITEEA